MHDRLIPFDRILNFRDFGGWETTDGARIARGKLFRSASFHDASDADITKLNDMDLRFLVDLRRPEERAHEPNKWPSEASRVIVSDEGAGGQSLPPHLLALMQSDLTPQSTRDYMTSLYREIPFDPRLIRLYRDWFAELAQGGAGVIHCAAGKDRTGIGCALTLIALGVDEEAVFAAVGLRRTVWQGVRLLDARLKACDLSNSDWQHAHLQRVEFEACNLTGMNFANAQWNHVRCESSKLLLAAFAHAKFTATAFRACHLEQADFTGADLRDVVFADCNLRQARFFGARLQGADLRGCDLTGFGATAHDLRGAIVEARQLVDLAPMLGVIVK